MSDTTSLINPDSTIDAELVASLNLDSPKSFFLFAGAGSGKTRSLVNVLNEIKKRDGNRLKLHAQKVAVITYTNAACDEIMHRIGFDQLFSISTIHSFSWELIKTFQNDIRSWLRINLAIEIAEIKELQVKSRSTFSKTYVEREEKIRAKEARLTNLDTIQKFSYNPNGDNRERDSLNHTEVISLGSYFIREKQICKKILIQKYPILLIDESQDTNKQLIESLFLVQKEMSEQFSLGLLGDSMQRIYSDGKTDLGKGLSADWKQPTKIMNYRCPKRIVKLINQIRYDVDGIVQSTALEKEEGFVRLFLVKNNVKEKNRIEEVISSKMAEITQDELWKDQANGVKCLTLEHHMAASRMGFLDFYEPLSRIDRLKTSLLDGSLPGIVLLTQCVLPLLNTFKLGDSFEVARIVRINSPLLRRIVLAGVDNQIEMLKTVNEKIKSLMSLWDGDRDPSMLLVLKAIYEMKIFTIHESILPIVLNSETDDTHAEKSDDEESDAWRLALSCPFSMIEKYQSYVSNTASFGTHQGVKGLEFDRVMVILDDTEARGFMFSYEKLFGVKEKTKTDLDNEAEGNETGIDRTKRLFYVICSRAKQSLAIVAYTENPKGVKQFVCGNSWFDESEIIEV